MRESDKIEIVPVRGSEALERANARLRALILSRERTIPGSRGFGLSGDFLDAPCYDAASQFGVELEEKADEYIPEIDITEVQADAGMDGTVQTRIFVEWRDGHDNGNQ